jgi:hypothetical protein
MSQIILSALVFTLIAWAFYEAGAFVWRQRLAGAKCGVTVSSFQTHFTNVYLTIKSIRPRIEDFYKAFETWGEQWLIDSMYSEIVH